MVNLVVMMHDVLLPPMSVPPIEVQAEALLSVTLDDSVTA